MKLLKHVSCPAPRNFILNYVWLQIAELAGPASGLLASLSPAQVSVVVEALGKAGFKDSELLDKIGAQVRGGGRRGQLGAGGNGGPSCGCMEGNEVTGLLRQAFARKLSSECEL